MMPGVLIVEAGANAAATVVEYLGAEAEGKSFIS